MFYIYIEMQGNDERRTNNKEISRAQNKIDNRKHEKRLVLTLNFMILFEN